MRNIISFASKGRIGIINPDGTEERYLDFNVPNQAIWQFGPQFSDGRRIIVHSYEDAETWLGNVLTHIWIYDICLLNPFTGHIQQLTENVPPLWDFRPQWSPDGSQLVFSRVGTGTPCEVWVMDADGTNQRFLTRGQDNMGADFGRWLTLTTE